MSIHVRNFKCWYSDILNGLDANGNAGFVILMVAFPLLERYLREKSGVHEGDLTDPFYDELRHVFPALPDNAVARQFWQVYRNGLLHQVTLSQQNRQGLQMPDGWLSSHVDALTIDASGDFWVHPAKFAKTVIQMIETDFTTFEGQHSVSHPLPVVHVTSSGTSSVQLPPVPPTGVP
jgi:hypothetical protein